MTRNEYLRQEKQGAHGRVASAGVARWGTGRSAGCLEPGKARSRIILETC